ncbi:twin-arginine translocation signal domain-containing protein, partial [Acinetobacter baumannii]
MGGLSRRQFLARTAALAAALGVSVETLAPQLALAQTDPGEIPSTLLQTILYGPVTKGS